MKEYFEFDDEELTKVASSNKTLKELKVKASILFLRVNAPNAAPGSNKTLKELKVLLS